MKLNLLPATATVANRTRGAVIGSVIFVVVCGVATAAMMIQAKNRLEKATELENTAIPLAQRASEVAKQADAAAATPEIRALNTNVDLARAMLAHNAKYPVLYESIKPYIPSFFRLTQLSAAPIDDKQSTVNMQGVIRTYQEYADLMIALLRVPGAISVGRAGFTGEDVVVPTITEIDQNGRPRKLSQSPIPDDPLERLTYFEEQPKEEGYLNVGNFGSGQEGLRTITPNASLISVSVVLPRNLQTPTPRETLASLGSAPASGTTTGAPSGAGTAAAGGSLAGAPPGFSGGVPGGAGAPGAAAADDR